jgi:hypothetical protein
MGIYGHSERTTRTSLFFGGTASRLETQRAGRRSSILFVKLLNACFLAGLLTEPADAQEISLVPVGASGSHTIIGNEIELRPGTTVTLEIRISDWNPDLLQTYAAVIDSTGYATGLSGFLTPATIPCDIDEDCFGASLCGNQVAGLCDVMPTRRGCLPVTYAVRARGVRNFVLRPVKFDQLVGQRRDGAPSLRSKGGGRIDQDSSSAALSIPHPSPAAKDGAPTQIPADFPWHAWGNLL